MGEKPDQKLAQQLAATTQSSSSRCCFFLHIDPEQLSEYVEAHQHVWPEMRQALTDSGWRNYSLFLQPEIGRVVGYFEADDVEKAQASLAKHPVNSKWRAEMARYFVQPDGGTNDEVLPQYFYLA